MTKQKGLFDKFIQILTHSIDPVPKNLDHYEIVIVGDILGGILTHNLTKFTHGHKDIMYVTKSKNFEMNCLRPLYEQKRLNKLDYFILPVLAVNRSIAQPVDPSIKSIDPVKNKIHFENGREITYSTLVLDNELKYDISKIEGFTAALNDPEIPVFSTIESENLKKYYKSFSLFHSGNAVVTIPKFPFQGETEMYNFLMALDYFTEGEKTGLVSPQHKLIILNENDRFCSYSDKLNEMIVRRLSSNPKVEVIYGAELNKIDGEERKAFYKTKEGNMAELEFSYIYVHPPTKSNSLLGKAGILEKNENMIRVDQKTLQHKKFENIFSFGSGIDLPQQPSFLGSVRQGHVVRHNTLQMINGRTPNAHYNGDLDLNLFTGISSLVNYSVRSGQEQLKEGWFNEQLQYKLMIQSGIKKFTKIYTSKKAGPPSRGYQKFPDGSPVSANAEKATN